MIKFNSLTEFNLTENKLISNWLEKCLVIEGCKIEEIEYIFCTDNYLLEINNKYLKHNTLTDIISFDYSIGKTISGDIFISIERVKENASIYSVSLNDELHRVMVHGILHFCGYKDKTEEEKILMRSKEDYYLSLRTF